MIGFDNWRPNQMLVLDLQFRETTGTVTRDFSKEYHDPATLTGAPTWAVLGNDLSYLSFDPGNPDRINILAADSTALNFTAGSFSGACWIYPDAYGNRYFMDKGSSASGWAFWLSASSPYLAVTTRQVADTQHSYGGPGLLLSAWQFVGFTRSGADVALYLNGVNVTTTPDTHVNPDTAAANDFTIGTLVGASAGWYDGRMWRPRVWERQIAAWEMAAIYQAERDLFGV